MDKPYKLMAEFNERAKEMLDEICKWRDIKKIDALRMALAVYYLIESKRHEGNKVAVLVSSQDDSVNERFWLPEAL